jgi:hypothetical protein
LFETTFRGALAQDFAVNDVLRVSICHTTTSPLVGGVGVNLDRTGLNSRLERGAQGSALDNCHYTSSSTGR